MTNRHRDISDDCRGDQHRACRWDGCRCVCHGGDDDPPIGTPQATARSSGPPSSKAAAQAHNRSGRTAAHASIVLTLVRRWPGSTYRELHHAQGMDAALSAEEIMRRLADLAKADKRPALVRRGPEKICNVRKTAMTTWFAVEETP